MAEAATREAWRSRLKKLGPTVAKARLMLGAARHAFNRHSQAQLEEIARMQKDIVLDMDPIFEKLEKDLEKSFPADKPDLLELQVIVSQLELLARAIAQLAEPIRRKGNKGAILGDKDFFHVNDLFSQQTGLLRALEDIFNIDDAALKAYVLSEAEKLRDQCYHSEVEHETRMMEGPGQAGAWSIYIDLLNRFRDLMGHLINIVKGLG